MLVIATKKGYYKRIREVGDKFEYPIKKGDDMPSWMEKIGKAAADRADAAATEAAEQAKKDDGLAAEASNIAAATAEDAATVANEEADKEDDLLSTDEDAEDNGAEGAAVAAS